MSTALHRTGRWRGFREDLAKVPAFFRRDLLSLLSYRVSYITDWVNLIVQVFVFYFISKLIPPDTLPEYGGEPTSYIEYVTVAITLTGFIQASLGRLIAAIRNEQMMGTLESLMVMPMSPEMLQIEIVLYDLVYVPVRTVVFFGLVTVLFDVQFNLAGLLPTALIFLVFTPFMWGLGVLSAAAVLTFKRGSGLVGIVGTLLTLTSGAYFPIDLLPLGSRISQLTIRSRRRSKPAAKPSSVSSIGPSCSRRCSSCCPLSIISLAVGLATFRLALQRERWRGTMGLY